MVIFQSLGFGIVGGDLNRAQDVFLEPLAPWGTADTDGGGIPDAWLQHYFGHPTGQSGDLSRAHDDADGDGMTNFQEYLAGTDPLNSASLLRLIISPRNSSDGMATLNWQVSPGKHYSVTYKDNLSDSNWQQASGNVYVIGTQGYFRIAPNQSNRYYRLRSGTEGDCDERREPACSMVSLSDQRGHVVSVPSFVLTTGDGRYPLVVPPASCSDKCVATRALPPLFPTISDALHV